MEAKRLLRKKRGAYMVSSHSHSIHKEPPICGRFSVKSEIKNVAMPQFEYCEMKKNESKKAFFLRKNLHISVPFCNFAPRNGQKLLF
jgi:hypothetical protein